MTRNALLLLVTFLFTNLAGCTPSDSAQLEEVAATNS